MSLLHLEDIRKTFYSSDLALEVLKGISLDIDKGEYVALMGTSGSGKTTLMNILGCLDRPTSGRYWIDGEETSLLNSDERAHLRNRTIGFVFQSFNLLARTSALENVLMPLTYASTAVDPRTARERAEQLLHRLGLGDRMEHEPARLSGGQQQRVAIARALINRPSLLLADEPTGNLDSQTTDEVLDLFRALNEQDGITIVIVTHEGEVADRTKRTIRMKDGLIADPAAGSDEPLKRKP